MGLAATEGEGTVFSSINDVEDDSEVGESRGSFFFVLV